MKESRRHIVFLNSWYPSRVLPTNGDFIQRHAEAVALGHKVSALHVITDNTLDKGMQITDETKEGVRSLIAYIAPARLPWVKVYQFVRAYRRLLRMAGKADIIHVNRAYPAGIVAWFLYRFKGIPYLVTEHWTGYLPESGKQMGRVEGMLMPWITGAASFVCPVSDNLAQSMLSLGFKGRYRPVPNVVKTSIFYRGAKEGREEQFKVLHVSSLMDAHKNISGLLEAMARFMSLHPEVRFTMIGERPGRYLSKVQNLRIDLSRVELIDQIPQEELSVYMREADVFVLFSNEENLPCVILEAFASGTPVVSTDVGGISEYFPDNFGILVKREEEEELVAALTQILSGSKRLAPPETLSRYVEDRFSPEIINEMFGKLYVESLASS